MEYHMRGLLAAGIKSVSALINESRYIKTDKLNSELKRDNAITACLVSLMRPSTKAPREAGLL